MVRQVATDLMLFHLLVTSMALWGLRFGIGLRSKIEK